MKNKNVTIVSIILVTICITVGLYLIISSRISVIYTPNYDLEDFYVFPEKVKGVNEYSVVNITVEDMVKTYFNTYIYMLFEEPDRAYTYLEEEWGLDNYPNIYAFKEKISSLTDNYAYFPIFDSYLIDKDEESNNVVYKVKDKRGNIYVFTVEAVMKYTIRFE